MSFRTVGELRGREHGRCNLIGGDTPEAMSALAITDDSPVRAASIKHAQVGASTAWADQSDGTVLGRPGLASGLVGHDHLLKSSWVYFFRRLAGMASPAVLIPHMLAAVAQPTRQSNQWLSGLVGRGDHSRTVP